MELSPESDLTPKDSDLAADADPDNPTPDSSWTPVKFVIALVLAILLGGSGAGFALVWRGDLGFKKKPYNPLLASLKAEPKARLGADIWVRFEVVNQSSKAVPITDHTGRSERQDQYDVLVRPLAEKEALPTLGPEVKETKGAEVRETKSFEPMPIILLPPEKKISWRLNLARYVTITKAGRYEVTISRHPFLDQTRVEAPPIILQID
ncbi:MAG: hypothetical protein P1V97_05350 [Planctomycetota bacterium]|nr:hypothetical protein [Planctomycetota bacterium]